MYGNMQTLIIIIIVALCTFITRVLPFLFFNDNRKLPAIVDYLGKCLPYAVIAILVVYCLKGISFADKARWLPEALSVAGVVGIHVLKRNTLLSIAGGTLLYMVLLKYI